jgi:chitin synthase
MASRNHHGGSRAHIQISDVPIPTNRRPPQHAGTLRRNKTLTRPERGVATVPLIAPPAIRPGPGTSAVEISGGNPWSVWNIFCHAVTFWAPPFLLSSVGGLKDRPTRQAWREKFGLCTIALGLGAVIGFLTVGLDRALCPQNLDTNPDRFIRIGSTPGLLGISGWSFVVSNAKNPAGINLQEISRNLSGFDISGYFNRDITTNYPRCRGLKFQAAVDSPCPDSKDSKTCLIPEPLSPSTLSTLNLINNSHLVGYDWGQINELNNYFVLDGAVLNFAAYMKAHPKPLANDTVDRAIRTVLQQKSGGRDATRIFYTNQDLRQAAPCIQQRYYAGNIDKITPGCVVSQLILYAGLIVILGLVVVRFAMACVFNWFISARLTAPPKNLSRTVISPAVMPEGANVQVNSKNGTAPWSGEKKQQLNRSMQRVPGTSPIMSMSQIGAELFTVCLVTCYSEGEEGIKGTLDSISSTSYSDSRKLIFIVCDGMITGAGEKLSTPDICVNLLDVDQRFGEPAPMAYVAVGLGDKSQNRAMVYAGFYSMLFRSTWLRKFG